MKFNILMMSQYCTFLCAAFTAALILWHNAAAFAAAPKFQNGDRICFIGDSITHGGSYHGQILLFYVTRFPQMRLEAWNCGIGGDSAEGGAKRYDWDIAIHKPTVATIMMGMNDVNRGLYVVGKNGPQVEEQKRTAIDGNISNMDNLATLLSKDGARLIFITPSLFDQTGNQKAEKLFGVNDALKACAEGDRKLAEKYGAGLVEFNGPMESVNKEMQSKDPNFTLVGSDRIHPGSVGHLVMAYLFLKEQGISPIVASMSIDAGKAVVIKQENCEISRLSTRIDAVSFESLEKALPFPVASSAKRALELIPFMDDLNKETLQVSGLKEGMYEVLIDGEPVIKTTSVALADGINLAEIKETPQYKQAMEVQNLLEARADLENNKLRVFALVNHKFFSDLKERTPEVERRVLEQKLENLRNTEGKHNQTFISWFETYLKFILQRDFIEHQVSELLDNAYAANKTKAHLYEIRFVQ